MNKIDNMNINNFDVSYFSITGHSNAMNVMIVRDKSRKIMLYVRMKFYVFNTFVIMFVIDDLRCIDQKENYLYENLVQIVGTELDIRKRQRLFIIQDGLINTTGSNECTQISSGSLAEGLNLPGSDLDIMNVINYKKVIPNVKDISKQTNNTNIAEFYVMETDFVHPGFSRLLPVEIRNGAYVTDTCYNCPSGSCDKGYLSSKRFLDHAMRMFPNMKACVHGPCISDEDQTLDLAFCMRSNLIPSNAIPWESRHRCQWPPNLVINRIINYGCLFVPIGPKILSNNESLWRVSFSVAEQILVHSFNFTQFLCYGLLKLTLKRIINTIDEVKDLVCSYFLKTALFWVSEEVDIETFHLSKTYYCFSLCLKKIISWVNTCNCPNYFIPEHNMFLGKIDKSNNTILLSVLESILCGGIDGLLHNLFPLDNTYNGVVSATSKSPFLLHVLLNVLLFRTVPYNKDMTTNGNTYHIQKLYLALFQCIMREDTVTGWLLYASFYYVTRQFKVALKITDYALSNWSTFLMMTDTRIRNNLYRNKHYYTVHFPMTLQERVMNFHYEQRSPLIPEELQLEVEFRDMAILPNIMCHCLTFLCYHHLGELSNRRHALRVFYLAMKNNKIRSVNTLSNAITILGVCFEISGDKDMAYQCYDEALQCDEYVCPSAETRISKLFEI
ncbi:Hypothetical predicted protein [Mytilus galloprovincialis]|nr:Hypothetical predicted protein [Mytilus galloprovincialis]